MADLDLIENAQSVLDRFERWPTFHDAEVIELAFNRNRPRGPCAETTIHAWNMTDRVDARGCYELEKHARVTFRFERLVESTFADFNHQNCLLELFFENETVNHRPLLRVRFVTSFGLGGALLCERAVVVDVQPCDAQGKISP